MAVQLRCLLLLVLLFQNEPILLDGIAQLEQGEVDFHHLGVREDGLAGSFQAADLLLLEFSCKHLENIEVLKQHLLEGKRPIQLFTRNGESILLDVEIAEVGLEESLD